MLRGFLAVIFGPIFLIGSSVLLFWNDGRAVQTARSLAEGRGLVVEATASAIDPANDGKLIHVNGPVEAKAPVRDPQFGVSATGLRLMRNVEMYQWKEESSSGRSSGESREYEYVRVWNSTRIDSSHFRRQEGHENPDMRFSRASFAATDAALGAFIAPTIIAIAWFWYRPLVSAVVVLLGLALAYAFKTLASRKAAQAVPADALVRPQMPS